MWLRAVLVCFLFYVLSAATSLQHITSWINWSRGAFSWYGLRTMVRVRVAGNYSFHRSLGRIWSKTGEATCAHRDMAGLPERVRMVPSDLCLTDYRSFAHASLASCLGFHVPCASGAAVDAIVVMDSNDVLGMQQFACFWISFARTRLACLLLGRVSPQPAFLAWLRWPLDYESVTSSVKALCVAPRVAEC